MAPAVAKGFAADRIWLQSGCCQSCSQNPIDSERVKGWRVAVTTAGFGLPSKRGNRRWSGTMRAVRARLMPLLVRFRAIWGFSRHGGGILD